MNPPAERLPRVLYAVALDPSRKYGSLEEQTFLLARAFQERGGWFVPLFLNRSLPAIEDAYRQAGLSPEALDLRAFSWTGVRQLLALVRRHQIEIIHWNFYPLLTNCYVWALKLLAPRVRHLHTDHNSRRAGTPPARGLRRTIKRWLCGRYERIVGVSQFVTDQLRLQGADSNLVCCRHFVNTERFHPDANARQHVRQDLRAEKSFVALIIANLIPEKGVDVAIRAWRSFRRTSSCGWQVRGRSEQPGSH